MERETQFKTSEINTTETRELRVLTEVELEAVSGGVFRFIRAIAYPGTGTSGDGTGTNTQLWVTSAT